MPKNNKNENTADNIYGGVRYRFSYDDSRRAAIVRQMRLRCRGSRSFWLTVGMVSVFCAGTMAVSLIYKSTAVGAEERAQKNELDDAQAVTVSARVVTDRRKTYQDCFSVSDMDDRAREVYHLPEGVMVSEVFHREDGVNSGTVLGGDIIIAVDDVQTPDCESFHAVFSSATKPVKLVVYRQEKNLNLEYVVSHEE